MIDTSQCFRPSSDLVHRRVAGAYILVPIRGNVADMQRLFALDGAGEFAWEKLDGVHSVSDIAGCITEVFDVDAEQALSDLTTFMADLLEQDLVEKA